MKLFDQIFPKKENETPPPLPTWEEVVEALYDKDLDSFPHEVIEVLYSQDRSERYVILKSKTGFYTYLFERIATWDEDEWQNLSSHKNVVPGWWEEPLGRNNEKSFFGTLEALKKDLHAEPEYMQNFLPDNYYEMCDQAHYCPYLQSSIAHDLCYDLQMVACDYIRPSILVETEISKAKLLTYCNSCEYGL